MKVDIFINGNHILFTKESFIIDKGNCKLDENDFDILISSLREIEEINKPNIIDGDIFNIVVTDNDKEYVVCNGYIDKPYLIKDLVGKYYDRI